MKIVFVADNSKSIAQAEKFKKELEKKGHEVKMIIPLINHSELYYKIEYNKKEKLILNDKIKDDYRNFIKDIDIMHVFMPLKDSEHFFKLAKDNNKPITTTLLLENDDEMSVSRRYVYMRYLKNIFKKTKHVHCPTFHVAKELKKYNYPNQLHVLYAKVNKTFYNEKLSVKSNDFRILMVGNFNHRNEQEFIIKALKKYENKNSVVVNFYGIGKYLDKVIELANKYNVRINLLDDLDELKIAINNTDLFIYSSKIELEEVKGIDILASGNIPLVISNKKSLTKEFSLDERSNLSIKTKKELIKKIDYWFTNKTERIRMKRVYRNSSKRFKMDNVIRSFESMLKLAIFENKNERLVNTKRGRKIIKKVKKSRLTRIISNIFFYAFAVPILSLYNLFFLKVKIEGRRNLEDLNNGAILVSNHVHMLDSVMVGLAAFPRRVAYTGMKANFKRFIIGSLVSMFGTIPIPDSSFENKVFFIEMTKLVNKGKWIHFYPEGELVPYDNELREFKKGAFKLAVNASSPILPILIDFQYVGKKKKRKIYLRIGKPIYPDLTISSNDAIKELQEQTKNVMESLYQK
ncbi:1-acyl-sn-glycerol-3-phosphate acyltransferase [Haploplasma axanthum]|uniref:2-acyl-glycerophospho-ethanolamine acyltransferase n=1 Tax=Haploplasma axanthum TaxID=29552 RepID=A0A449BEW6_HAPAX|nr:1-acyl-sn-glycerol-3-phosphate acyltransferase [Haploplasma axanthum]VEU80991.1 2-acyl-glycerophospho-ethanolamine acyltransferase [Haploplasma axanthum]